MVGQVSESIPIDLVIDILSRLPGKSIARCRCVSKLWDSTLLSAYFNDLFVTRSSPRLLFAQSWRFWTSPHPQNPYDQLWLHATELDTKFPQNHMFLCGHASGFIHFHQVHQFRRRLEVQVLHEPAIFNPTTGQYAFLPIPLVKKETQWESFLGFDPIHTQFKVLLISLDRKKEEPDQVLTLGTGNDSWRKIQCPLNHLPGGEGLCINGVVYYLAMQMDGLTSLIVCFDVKSEKFKFIHTDVTVHCYDSRLVNYKGNLGVITLNKLFEEGDTTYPYIRNCLNLFVRKQEESELSKNFSWCWEDDYTSYQIGGMTATGDIVLMKYNPFGVLYINTRRNAPIQEVVILGLSCQMIAYGSIEVLVDYVEDIKFISKMKTTSSIFPPKPKPKRTTTLIT